MSKLVKRQVKEEEPDRYERMDYLKYSFGAETFLGYAEQFEGLAQEYRKLHELAEQGKITINGDGPWVWMWTNDDEIAKEYGFREREFEEEA